MTSSSRRRSGLSSAAVLGEFWRSIAQRRDPKSPAVDYWKLMSGVEGDRRGKLC